MYIYWGPARRHRPAPENKEEFVAQLGFLLAKHGVQGVNGLRYEKTDTGEELVKIFFDSGRIKVNVTGDSCLAIMKDIAKALT